MCIYTHEASVVNIRLNSCFSRPRPKASGKRLRRQEHYKNGHLFLWNPSSRLRGRTPKSIALPLPRLPEAHRQYLRHRRLLSRPGHVTEHGRSSLYTRRTDSGFRVTFHFCTDCGSTVFWKPERLPDAAAVAAGAFADPTFPKPSNAVHLESRHSWIGDL